MRTLILAVLLAVAFNAAAQTLSISELVYGEHSASLGEICDSTFEAETDTSAWIAFGTYYSADNALVYQRRRAPQRFTLFAWMDTTGTNAAAAPNLFVRTQVALDTAGFAADSVYVYENQDSTSTSDTLQYRHGIGHILPLTVYGGGYLRLILSLDDTSRVKVDLWEMH